VQDRIHNAVNEIDTDNNDANGPGNSIDNTTGSQWLDPSYDKAGNLTAAPSPLAPSSSGDDQAYTWDAWNRLVEVKHSSTSLARFSYDGLHRRIAKTVGSDTYHYYLSEQNQVLEERKDDGMTVTVRNEFVWHPYYVDALAARWYDSAGMGSGTYYYATHDANFNVTAMFSDGDSVEDRYFYTPYGQVLFLDASWTAHMSNVSDIDQQFLYTGRQLDPETGLFYYRARYYHQTLGRFLNRDPIKYGSGGNRSHAGVRNWSSRRGRFRRHLGHVAGSDHGRIDCSAAA
jgi:RHS repeat-associated protein